ncbi:hypothetical protein Cantr_06050 [Candida viswanathii]|uniref:Uncharacterized protein n=1 Tax=Candida viswanathii TaxID=5486 RepID=A0A367XVE2_9ASCO|nr:hypothetical protein Cantr_06050 [Candida viswanathii]
MADSDKTSSRFLRSLRSKRSNNELTRTTLRSSVSQRPLSISLSSFNLNSILSLPKLAQAETTITSITRNDSDKENASVKTLKPRSSVPILSKKPSSPAMIQKRHSTMFQAPPTTTNNNNNNNNNNSPQNTIQSHIDSIFDDSGILYVDSSEDDIISNTSSSSTSSTSLGNETKHNKLHRTTNSHTLSEFITKMHDEVQHGKINFDFRPSTELQDLEALNRSPLHQSTEFISRFTIVENAVVMDTRDSRNNNAKTTILDDDYLEEIKIGDYVEDDLIFNL